MKVQQNDNGTISYCPRRYVARLHHAWPYNTPSFKMCGTDLDKLRKKAKAEIDKIRERGHEVIDQLFHVVEENS